MKAVRLTEAARNDIETIIDYYLLEAGVEVALSFTRAWQSTLSVLARHPGIGSPRFAREVRIEGLRVWSLRGFPHLVLYLLDDDGPEVIRILHSARDIPSTLRE